MSAATHEASGWDSSTEFPATTDWDTDTTVRDAWSELGDSSSANNRLTEGKPKSRLGRLLVETGGGVAKAINDPERGGKVKEAVLPVGQAALVSAVIETGYAQRDRHGNIKPRVGKLIFGATHPHAALAKAGTDALRGAYKGGRGAARELAVNSARDAVGRHMESGQPDSSQADLGPSIDSFSSEQDGRSSADSDPWANADWGNASQPDSRPPAPAGNTELDSYTRQPWGQEAERLDHDAWVDPWASTPAEVTNPHTESSGWEDIDFGFGTTPEQAVDTPQPPKVSWRDRIGSKRSTSEFPDPPKIDEWDLSDWEMPE